MENKNRARQTINSLFNHPGNRRNLELFHKALSRSVQGFCLCRAAPGEVLKIFEYFRGDLLSKRIHFIDMVQPLSGPMELQKSILGAHERYGDKKNIFFIYNLESCIYLSKTSAKDFFQRINLIRDFFMGFKTTFVFFVTESSLKKMLQNAFDFYDWVKFTFTFLPESRDILRPLETGNSEDVKYSNIVQKIQYLKKSIEKTINEREKSVKLNELGRLYQQAGDFDSALERFLKSLKIEMEICEETNNRVEMAETCAHIGYIYEAKGDTMNAEKYFKLAQTIKNELKRKE